MATPEQPVENPPVTREQVDALAEAVEPFVQEADARLRLRGLIDSA
jgi:hypothetical protein